MHKYFGLFFGCILFSLIGIAQTTSFHSIQFEKKDGKIHKLSSYKGKNILVITTAKDVSVDFEGLVDLKKKYPELIVICLPVKRLSQTDTIVSEIATDGLLTLKESKDSTDLNGRLLNWLIKKEGNQHFVVADLQVGLKFFIDGTGELFAVMPPEFKLSDTRISAILARSLLVENPNK